MDKDTLKELNRLTGDCSNHTKNTETSGCLSLLGLLLFSIITFPISMVSYAYVSKCFYSWWMPYIIASYPQFTLTNFIAMNSLTGVFVAPYLFSTFGQVKLNNNNNISMKYFQIILIGYFLPWILLFTGWIFKLIITCFIPLATAAGN